MGRTLSGKVALVTGGARGIGAATALALADAGADVIVSYSASADKAEAVAREAEQRGVRALAFRADSGIVAEVEGLIAAVVAACSACRLVASCAFTRPASRPRSKSFSAVW